jgi:transcriptional regulator with XRE-family HTH domain
VIDRPGLALFLRRRREALQPEDVGLPRGQRRRTSGLRREEVAALCHISADYYSRLERERGPHPSEQMIASIAQGLHLSLDERDHLFRLAGHHPPQRGVSSDHISPGMLRIFDRLADSPAEIVTELGEALRQTPMCAALNGDATRFSGPARSLGYRWFTDPAVRERYPAEDHDHHARAFAAGLRQVVVRRGPASRAAQLARLLDGNEEFRSYWDLGEISVNFDHGKRVLHPELGLLDLDCQTLLDPNQSHMLVVFTATPGTESYEKLQLLSAVSPGR